LTLILSIIKKIYKRLIPGNIRNFIAILRKKGNENKLKHSVINYLKMQSANSEINQIIKHLKHNPLTTFPYDFIKFYDRENITVYSDSTSGLKYVLHDNKRIYFKKEWSVSYIKEYYNNLLIEQDTNSPHRYEQHDFLVKHDDIVVDVGAAEGNFALSVVERAKEIYLFETDSEWLSVLKETFAPWKSKVKIINKFVSDITGDYSIRLDDFLTTEVNFIKVDIEGAEAQLLNGAQKLLDQNTNIKIAICAYHKLNDEVILKKMLSDKGFYTKISDGYMLYESWINGKHPSFYLRRGLIRAQKNKSFNSLKPTVKYSILIPVYNGIDYLPSCVSSVISQDYTNYELIISDDHSTDDTNAYLNKLNHPNITIFHTPYKMSMTEHWNWILKHACGEWCIFVGQDDGLQKYFFELADVLTSIADKHGLKTITSDRAYYFWPGCESVYGDLHINYIASPKISFFNTKIKAVEALCGLMPYFNLPQMYTTSLFKRSLIKDIQSKQNGCFMITHPQDANLAAISCSTQKRYIHSFVPLGWVGTSAKSAGLAVVSEINKSLRRDYIDKITTSTLRYCNKIGEFEIGSTVLYFWGALIESKALQSKIFYKFITSRFVTYIVIAAGNCEVEKNKSIFKDNYLRIERINKINPHILFVLVILIRLIERLFKIQERLEKKIQRMIFGRVSLIYTKNELRTMEQASAEMEYLIRRSNILKKVKILFKYT
jgi:glycosyltransferase involved in cell wall biosynthesis